MAIGIKEIFSNLITVNPDSFVFVSSHSSKTPHDKTTLTYDHITNLPEFIAATSLSEQDAIIRKHLMPSRMENARFERIPMEYEGTTLEDGDRKAMTEIRRLREETSNNWQNRIKEIDLKAKSGVIVDFSSY